MRPFQTITQTILNHADKNPERIFCKLIFKGASPATLTYQQLIRASSRYVSAYRQKGVRPQEVVILVLDHGPDLIAAFVGAILMGAVPSIFAFPSKKISADVYEKTLTLLLKVSDAPHLLSHPDVLSPATIDHVRANKMWTPDVHNRDQFDTSFHDSKPENLVLLQHSSGTTGLKKGVALSNERVLNQIAHYKNALDLRPNDKIASWLPLYHDMGLIASFILPLVTGIPVSLISPFDWVADPSMLLEEFTNERATLCWQPNFAYHFLASNMPPESSKQYDLSSVRAFINCAEPIRAESHDLFLSAFQKYGVNKKALCTCYAMAENTFAVTQGGITEPVHEVTVDRDHFLRKHEAVPVNGDSQAPSRRLVSSGQPIEGQSIRLVDDNGKQLEDGCVGEIVIKSDSLLNEYYHRTDLTKEAIKDGWYMTGDLGFLLQGHLYVTGRKKDMLIVAGKNIYPQDIEEIVMNIDGVYPGRVVAFGVMNQDQGTEDVVVLVETKEKDELKKTKMKIAMAKAIREELECTPRDLVLVPHMWLIKSSSGKISRSGNKEKYLKGTGKINGLVSKK